MFTTLKSWLRGVTESPAEPKSLRWQPSLSSLEQRENPSGNLDMVFHTNGRQTLDFGSDDQAKAVAVQTDGKILVAGTMDNGSADFAVTRYNPDGTLDTTFGSQGKRSITFGGHDFCTGMAVQADGKIVLVGYTDVLGVNDFAIARLNADGGTDFSFDTDGLQTIDFGFDDRANGVAIQSNGKIVLAGSDDGGTADFAFARLNANGSLDNTFDADGKTSYTFNNHDFATSVALQPDGKIVAAGYSDAPGTNDFAVLRLNANGSLDNTFDTDGKQTVSFGSDDRANAVTVQADGRIVLAGSFDGGLSDFAVARLNADGSLDTTFSGDGKANFTFAAGGFGHAEFATSVVQQKDGKLVVGGYTDNDFAGGAKYFGVVRLNTNGSLDATFSGDGKQLVSFGASDDKAYAVALQADGDIVLAGTTTLNGSGNNSHDLALTRLTGRDTDLIARTADGNWWVNHTTGSSFAVSNVNLWNEAAGWRDVSSGDVNGDGRTDLIGRTSDGHWWVGVNNGDGTYTNSPFAAWNEAAGWRDVKVADFNGDGKADVAGRTSDGHWWVGLSTGTAFNTTHWAGWNEAAGWKDVKVADFNGDGKMDIGGRTSDGHWWVGTSDGTTFNTTHWAGWNEAAGWKDVSVADFNGDGKMDIAGRTSDGHWWLSASTGTAFNTTHLGAWNEAAGWHDVTVADFNGDGKADIAGRDVAGNWWVSTSNGTGFANVSVWANWNEAAGWHDVTVADFNGDGRADIAARTSDGNWWVSTSNGSALNTTHWGAWNEAAGWHDVLTGAFVG